MTVPKKRWRYQPDEQPKRKHAWDKCEAGFVEVDGYSVGKCPCDFRLDLAERLINDGIEFRPHRWRRSYPKRIYVVHDGVLYRAVVTLAGDSYHGFPESHTEFQRLPTQVKKEILALARQKGQLEEIKRWLKI